MNIEVNHIHHLTAAKLTILIIIRLRSIFTVDDRSMSVVILTAAVVLDLDHDLSCLCEACLREIRIRSTKDECSIVLRA